MDNYVITSLFGDSRTDHFHTGIDLFGIREPVKAAEDVSVVFFNKNRLNSINYGNGSFVVLQNSSNTVRYNYSHLEEGTFLSESKYFNSGDIVALSGNTGRSTGYHLHLEVEDLVNRRLLNPLKYFQVKDTRRPVIRDVFFVTMDNEMVSLRDTRRLVRGGKLFVSTYDLIDDVNFFQVPYSISVYINGKDFYHITFDSMDKADNDLFITGTDKNFYNLYSEPYVFYLKEKYFLPGIYGIKVEVSDMNGNRSIFNTSFRVLPPS